MANGSKGVELATGTCSNPQCNSLKACRMKWIAEFLFQWALKAVLDEAKKSVIQKLSGKEESFAQELSKTLEGWQKELPPELGLDPSAMMPTQYRSTPDNPAPSPDRLLQKLNSFQVPNQEEWLRLCLIIGDG
jgi:hypothetical protein